MLGEEYNHPLKALKDADGAYVCEASGWWREIQAPVCFQMPLNL